VWHRTITHGKESVTHRFELLESVGSGESLKRVPQVLNMLYDDFRRIFVTVGCEVDDVAE
jgi:hypothetical protein